MSHTRDMLPLETRIPESLGSVADLAGVVAGGAPAWLVLGTDGVLSRWAPDRCDVEALASLPPADESRSGEADKTHRRLHASACGRFAAVVDDYGSEGTVIDLASGRTTMRLNGGHYCAHVVPFALAFAEHEGAPVLIHRTDWNRLDVSDPATGRLLTARTSPRRSDGDDDPAHYLDYFHGALYPSPDGTRIYDDGWIWQPFGVPTVWSLSPWLQENVWESEDGPTRVDYAILEEWDRGVVWIGADRIAVQDVGDGDQPPCVRILDPTTLEPGAHVTSLVMRTVATFPGPGGRYFTDGALLLVSHEAGLEAWDIERGRKVFAIAEFKPVRQHFHSGELVEIGEGVVRRWMPQ